MIVGLKESTVLVRGMIVAFMACAVVSCTDRQVDGSGGGDAQSDDPLGCRLIEDQAECEARRLQDFGDVCVWVRTLKDADPERCGDSDWVQGCFPGEFLGAYCPSIPAPCAEAEQMYVRVEEGVTQLLDMTGSLCRLPGAGWELCPTEEDAEFSDVCHCVCES